MKKEIKNILTESRITAKWWNINNWKKEEYKNLLEAVKCCNIKFCHKKDFIILSMNVGNCSIKIQSDYGSLERDTILLVIHHAVYLGDKTIISSRFGTKKINF